MMKRSGLSAVYVALLLLCWSLNVTAGAAQDSEDEELSDLLEKRSSNTNSMSAKAGKYHDRYVDSKISKMPKNIGCILI
jgi:hypothetical protein